MKSKITSLMPFSEDENLWVLKHGEVTSLGHVSDERLPYSLLKVIKMERVLEVPLQDCFDLQKCAQWQQGSFQIQVQKDKERFVFVNIGPMISWQMGPKWYDVQRVFRNDILPTAWLSAHLPLAQQLELIFAFCQGQRPEALVLAEQEKLTQETALPDPTKQIPVKFASEAAQEKTLPASESETSISTQDAVLPPLSDQASALAELTALTPDPVSAPLEEAPFEDDLPDPEIDTEALGRIKNINHGSQSVETGQTVVIGGKSYQAKVKKEPAITRYETFQKSRSQTPDGAKQKVQRSRTDEDDLKIQALADSLGNKPETQPSGCGKTIANIIWLIVIVWFIRMIFGF